MLLCLLLLVLPWLVQWLFPWLVPWLVPWLASWKLAWMLLLMGQVWAAWPQVFLRRRRRRLRSAWARLASSPLCPLAWFGEGPEEAEARALRPGV